MIDEFHTRLRTPANTCDFHDVKQEILPHILHGCLSSRLRRKGLKKRIDEQSSGVWWRKCIDKFENLLCALDVQDTKTHCQRDRDHGRRRLFKAFT